MGNYNVLFTSRNSEKFIEPSLTSIIEQSIKPKYIIVLDDGSSDNTYIFKTNSKRNNNKSSVIINIIVPSSKSLIQMLGYCIFLFFSIGIESVNTHI